MAPPGVEPGPCAWLCGPRSYVAHRVLLMVFCCLLTALGSNVFSITIYTNTLKATFNLTQTQVSTAVAILNLGHATGFPAGLILERWGHGAALVVGGSLGGASYGILAVACHFREAFQDTVAQVGVIVVVYLAGLASSFSFIIPTATAFLSFPDVHRARIMALDECTNLVGIMLWTIVYGTAFINGHVVDEANQDLQGFFVLLSVMFVVLHFISVPFVRVYGRDEEDSGTKSEYLELNDDHVPVKNEVGDEVSSSTTRLMSSEDDEESFSVRTRRLLRDSRLYLLACGVILSSAVQDCVIFNAAVIIKSFNLQLYHGIDIIFVGTVLTTASCAVLVLAQGWLSDYVYNAMACPRVILEVAWNIVLTAIFIMFYFWTDSLVYLIIIVVMCANANTLTWLNVSNRVVDYFGEKHCGTDLGFIAISMRLFGWIILFLAGHFYDDAIIDPLSANCYGSDCYSYTFVMLIILSSLGGAFNTVAFIRDRKAMLLEKEAQTPVSDTKQE